MTKTDRHHLASDARKKRERQQQLKQQRCETDGNCLQSSGDKEQKQLQQRQQKQRRKPTTITSRATPAKMLAENVST